MHNIKENIIIPAWEIIRDNTSLKKYYFFPGLMSIIVLTVLLVYQSIYTYVVVMGQKEKALEMILDFFHSAYVFHVLIGGLIFFLLYILIIPLFEGGMIKYIDAKHKNEDLTMGNAMGVGMYKFFPLFEYNNIFSEFKFIAILNAYLFTLRFVGMEYISYVSYLFLFVFFLSVVINVLFAYSKYEIVLGNKKTFASVGSSSKMAILMLGTSLKLYFLMFFFNIRVILNFIIFLSFPIIMVVALSLITSKIFLTIAITILSILFIVCIIILGYMAGVLDIFKTAIWYFAYLEGKKRVEQVENEDN